MVKFRCNEPGCVYTTEKEGYMKQHYRKNHGKEYVGGSAVAEETLKEDTFIGENEFQTNEPIRAVDPLNILRTILDNNGWTYKKESIMNLFSNYDMADLPELYDILKMSGMKPTTREMVMKTYAAALELDWPPEKEEEEEKVKKSTGMKAYRNPMDISPEEIAQMSDGQRMQYQNDLMKHAAAMKWQREQMNMVWQSMGMASPGMGGSAPGQRDPETEAMLKEYRDMKEQEKLQKMLSPMARRLEELTDIVGGKKGNSNFEDIKEMALTMKLLETLGTGKETESLRAMAEQRMQELRNQQAQQQAQAQQALEAIKSQNIALQMKSIQDQMGTQLAVVQQQLTNANMNKQTVLSNVQEMIALQQALTQLQTGQVPLTPEERREEKRYQATTEMVKSIATGAQPLLEKVAENLTGKNPPTPVNAAPPMAQAQTTARPTSTFPCQNCGKPISVVGNPPIVTCTSCGQVHKEGGGNEPQERVLPEPYISGAGEREPTEEEIIEELVMQPRDILNKIAIENNIDPGLYDNKQSLAEVLAKVRR